MFKQKKNDNSSVLQEQLAQQTSIVNAISRSMAMIEFHPSGEIITANQNFLLATGYALDEVQGQHHRIFCEPDYAASQDYASFWEKLNRGEFCSGQFKRVNKSGEPLWLEATYTPVYDSGDQLIKIVKFASDITERVIEQAKNKAKLDALSKSTAIVEFEPDGTIVDCNENFTATVGYSKSDIIGKHHRMFCDSDYADSSEYRSFWSRLNNGEFFQGMFKRVNSRGETLWLEASYNPVYDNEGKLHRVVKFASDITEQTTKAEAERESAKVAYRISDETSKTASEGGDVIKKAVAEINKIAGSVSSSSQHIESLNKQSAEISSIINTIQSIADQTNLLALNAAIEAARAGEQGRGFAVVADEVRQLAARTSQSTSEISAMITSIQQDTGNASSSMEQCLDQVNLGVELANQTGEVITKIQQGAYEVVAAIDKFSNALQK